MKRLIATALAAATLTGLAACSEQTQADASKTAELAGDDIEANAAVVGEVIEDGTKKAAGAVSEGAANLERNIEEGDKETPGPAPILGDELNRDQADAEN
ncbi:hypothetical protein LCM19_08690 [Qipengyuania flava]|uniref:hypothetical protein n=1 Tax=Qipengyuania sp. NPDC077563 TaxID=3364497 RepID=UPI001CD1C69A|nr:hypothetical protein [Qipengyuania flava]